VSAPPARPEGSKGREAFYGRAETQHLAPLWTRLKSLVPKEPTPVGVAHRWAYADVRPYVLEAAEHISAQEAERRVLILENPALAGSSQITQTLYAGLQLIMPGEVAPAHRHTQSALRFIVEGSGAFTAVDGEATLMNPGDFVITPSWTWHHHGHEATGPTAASAAPGPVVWLDGLDIPITHFFGSTFREDHEHTEAALTRPTGDALARYGSGLLPVGYRNASLNSPVFNYPYARTREALHALTRAGAPDAHQGHLMRYVNPADGGWAMPTMATMIRLLPRGFATRPYRSSDSAVFVVVEGEGELRVGDRQRFALTPHDVVVVPGWMAHTLHASEDLVLFSYSDRVAQEKLGFWRDERQ
jgi:gentisate 1,2-dioxygenase